MDACKLVASVLTKGRHPHADSCDSCIWSPDIERHAMSSQTALHCAAITSYRIVGVPVGGGTNITVSGKGSPVTPGSQVGRSAIFAGWSRNCTRQPAVKFISCPSATDANHPKLCLSAMHAPLLFTQVEFIFASGTFNPNSQYKFVAYASNAAGEGPPSAPITFTKVPGAPVIDSVVAASGALNLVVSPPADIGTSGTPPSDITP